MNISQTEAQQIIKAAVDKFLCWKLPQNFNPDSFISFDGEKHDTWGGYPNSWPTGTNLFDGEQAKAMFEHCLSEVLQSRLAEGEQAPWQPIETAPKNVFVLITMDAWNGGMTITKIRNDGRFEVTNGRAYFYPERTHWMPLPSAPKGATK